jgi:hypothetical protein
MRRLFGLWGSVGRQCRPSASVWAAVRMLVQVQTTLIPPRHGGSELTAGTLAVSVGLAGRLRAVGAPWPAVRCSQVRSEVTNHPWGVDRDQLGQLDTPASSARRWSGTGGRPRTGSDLRRCSDVDQLVLSAAGSPVSRGLWDRAGALRALGRPRLGSILGRQVPPTRPCRNVIRGIVVACRQAHGMAHLWSPRHGISVRRSGAVSAGRTQRADALSMFEALEPRTTDGPVDHIGSRCR